MSTFRLTTDPQQSMLGSILALVCLIALFFVCLFCYCCLRQFYVGQAGLKICHIAQAGLELLILQLLPPKSWDYRPACTITTQYTGVFRALHGLEPVASVIILWARLSEEKTRLSVYFVLKLCSRMCLLLCCVHSHRVSITLYIMYLTYAHLCTVSRLTHTGNAFMYIHTYTQRPRGSRTKPEHILNLFAQLDRFGLASSSACLPQIA